MFSGAGDIFKNTTARNVDPLKSSHQMKTSTRLVMRDVLRYEYEFYHFIKQRFHKAKQEAGLLNPDVL